jgi:hypothetical protein
MLKGRAFDDGLTFSECHPFDEGLRPRRNARPQVSTSGNSPSVEQSQNRVRHKYQRRPTQCQRRIRRTREQSASFEPRATNQRRRSAGQFGTADNRGTTPDRALDPIDETITIVHGKAGTHMDGKRSTGYPPCADGACHQSGRVRTHCLLPPDDLLSPLSVNYSRKPLSAGGVDPGLPVSTLRYPQGGLQAG